MAKVTVEQCYLALISNPSVVKHAHVTPDFAESLYSAALVLAGRTSRAPKAGFVPVVHPLAVEKFVAAVLRGEVSSVRACPDGSILSSALWRVFRAWATAHNSSAAEMSNMAFSFSLREMGYVRKRTYSGVVWRGFTAS